MPLGQGDCRAGGDPIPANRARYGVLKLGVADDRNVRLEDGLLGRVRSAIEPCGHLPGKLVYRGGKEVDFGVFAG